MSGCSSTYNGACPSPVQEVNVHQTFLSLADGSGMVEVFNSDDFSGTTLTLPYTPLLGYTVQVFVNGLLQGNVTHFTISGNTITFNNTLSHEAVQVVYAASASGMTEAVQVLRYVADITGTQIILPRIPGPLFPVTVYVNGVLQVVDTHYTVASNVITFTYTLAGDTVQVLYSM